MNRAVNPRFVNLNYGKLDDFVASHPKVCFLKIFTYLLALGSYFLKVS